MRRFPRPSRPIAALAAVTLAAWPAGGARAQELPMPDLSIPGLPTPSPPAPPTAAPVDLPRDVAAFLRRRAGCNRLIDRDGGEPDRVAESVRSRFRLKCSTLEDDERRLRARYAAAPGVVEILDQADEAE